MGRQRGRLLDQCTRTHFCANPGPESDNVTNQPQVAQFRALYSRFAPRFWLGCVDFPNFNPHISDEFRKEPNLNHHQPSAGPLITGRLPLVSAMLHAKDVNAGRLNSEARKPRTCITPSMLAVLQRCVWQRTGPVPQTRPCPLCLITRHTLHAAPSTCTAAIHRTRCANGSRSSCTCRRSRSRSGSRTGAKNFEGSSSS